ncbi:MAG: Verru Chthon cassette protein, partial [Verrucomicrobiaceae bacterium]|nr:Verru Chthon cassette protein [Verrucomicrobiaceae bacterium]
PDEKRIQICLLIETFVPSVGYTRYTPDFTLVLNPDQVSGIKIKNSKGQFESVFKTTDLHMIVQSTYAYAGDERGLNAGHDVSPLGGHFAPSAFTNGRQLLGIQKMPRDAGYQDKNTSNIHAQMLNFPLVSNFLTVKRQQGTSTKPGTLEFKVEKPLEVDIYATHDWQGTLDPANGIPSQVVNIKFPSGTQSTPVPHLVVYSTERRDYIDSSGNHFIRNAIPAPHWWAFNSDGAVNRWTGTPDQQSASHGSIVWKESLAPATTPATELTFGRFRTTGYTGSVPSRDSPNNPLAKGNGANIPAGGLIYGWSSVSTYNGVMANPDKDLGNVDVYRPTSGNITAMGGYGYYGSDSVRSIIPVHGDYRILAARKVVDPLIWHKHPVWDKRPQALFAHSLSGSYSDAAVGFDLGGATDTTSDPKYRLVSNAYYEPNNSTDPDGKTGRLPVIPDTPLTAVANAFSTRYRDFDNGPGNLRDGPYINKPDDGNMSVMKFWHGHGTADKSGVQAGYYAIRNTYFTSSFLQLPATSAYFTPNRIMSSPGMFGSLSTGVWGSQPGKMDVNPTVDGIPWRTLLFRADVDGHVGAPSWSAGAAGHGVAPADHYFMDLFFMPIVEPYAITDSYSTAGKINLNYQIVPFTYIRRATAVYAAMKGEMITAYSSVDTDPRKAAGLPPSDTNTVIYKKIKDINPIPPDLWNENTDHVYWHREINVDETVRQLDERFAFKGSPATVGSVGLMLAPSQICELHLIPIIPPGTARQGKGTVPSEPTVMTGLDEHTRKSTMLAYWQHNDLTGDNTRERPYANLYQKFTTRSNTYRVYFTAQTLVKARSLQPTQVDTRRDTITAEYRGSALLERYLDFSNAGAAALGKYDYGSGQLITGMPSLERFYHYRILEMKQFSP